jgi:alkyl hydroperoxide reductase subunit AhpC
MIQIGKPAPDFTVPAVVNKAFQDVSLSSYKGKYVVLFFYPLDFTFVCPTEITAFSDMADEFAKINTQILGCSVDSKFSHLSWINVPRKEGGLGDLKFPLLSDITKTIARDYNVLIEEAGITLRGVFIIDANGILKVSMVNDNAIGRNTKEVFRLVQAIQFNEKNGEVCPANWEPGSDTIKPDVAKSKEYFHKNG